MDPSTSSVSTRTAIHEWKNGSLIINVYQTGNHELEAEVTSPTEGIMKLGPRQIKCGIEKTTSHNSFLQKIESIAKEKIKDFVALFVLPIEGQTEEIWMFEATSLAASWIKKASISLEQMDVTNGQKKIESYRSALKNFATALKIQENKKGQIFELQSVIAKLKKELGSFVLRDISLNISYYLPSQEDVDAFNEIVEAYQQEDDIFSCLSDHLEACKDELSKVLTHYLLACVHEGQNELQLAGEDYINLSQEIKSSDHIKCCKTKAEALMGVNSFQQVLEQKGPSYEILILQAEECLKKIEGKSEALKHYQKALLLCQDSKKQFEIKKQIQAIKKTLFLEKVKSDEFKRFLPLLEHQLEFVERLEMYQEYDDIFSPLLEIGQCEMLSKRKAYDHLMCAWAYEALDESVLAAENYLRLARQKGVDSVFCLKHALNLFKEAEAISFAHFLENIDRKWLEKLVKTTDNIDAKRTLLQKDAIRMTFERYLDVISKSSNKSSKPTSYICFTFESGITEWLEHTLIPDLYKIGIQPIFCLEQLGPGKELNTFQAKIRDSDQVIVICTPLLKQICDTRKEAITGVAMEIRLMIERYNDANKHDTIYPIYLKGERKTACPTVFIEGVLGSKIPPIDESKQGDTIAYYSTVFELFGAMRGVDRKLTRNEIKEKFLIEAAEIIEKTLMDSYDEQLVAAWRREKALDDMLFIPTPDLSDTKRKRESEITMKSSYQFGAERATINTTYDQEYEMFKKVGSFTSREIARFLWLDLEAYIDSDLVDKVNYAADYLKKQGFELKGVKSDGDCFCNAYVASYESLPSQKLPILNSQKDKVKYLREMIAAQFVANSGGSGKSSRVQEIKKLGEWLQASGEGDLLAQALTIPIRLITVHKDQGGLGISDTLTFREKEKSAQDWSTIHDSEKPQEYITIVDFGGHFLGVRHLSAKNF